LTHEPALKTTLIAPRQAIDILDFWFGNRPYTREAMSKRMRLWFGEPSAPELQPQADEALRLRFSAQVCAAARGDFDVWESSPRRRLALILLLDQFPRGIYRDSAQAYSQDHRALALAVSGTQLGADAALDPVERIFFYMPMQHAESRELQEESVSSFRRLVAEGPAELAGLFTLATKLAERHRDIVERFGRFPQRNAMLGRTSTAEEAAWLVAEAPRFSS
jgi:uncharacterized protein (DUF924 family)